MSCRERRHPDRAAIGLAGLLLLLPLLRATPLEVPECRTAAPSLAWGDRTVEVVCGGRRAPLSGPARHLFGQKIDLNRASADTLQVLPGIGPRRAEAIVRERASGRFARIEELTRVPGIGRRTLEGLSDWVMVGGPVLGPVDAGAFARPTLGALEAGKDSR